MVWRLWLWRLGDRLRLASPLLAMRVLRVRRDVYFFWYQSWRSRHAARKAVRPAACALRLSPATGGQTPAKIHRPGSSWWCSACEAGVVATIPQGSWSTGAVPARAEKRKTGAIFWASADRRRDDQTDMLWCLSQAVPFLATWPSLPPPLVWWWPLYNSLRRTGFRKTGSRLQACRPVVPLHGAKIFRHDAPVHKKG